MNSQSGNQTPGRMDFITELLDGYESPYSAFCTLNEQLEVHGFSDDEYRKHQEQGTIILQHACLPTTQKLRCYKFRN